MGVAKTYGWQNVFYRVGMKSAEALRRMRLCEIGDAQALNGLNGPQAILIDYTQNPAKQYAHEWGVGRDKDQYFGDCIIIKGEHSGVEWGAFLDAGVIPIAHSHPFRRLPPNLDRFEARKHQEQYGNANSLEEPCGWDWLIRENDQAIGARLKILPSASDFRFCANKSLAIHRVETAYVVRQVNGQGGGTLYEVQNPDGNGFDPAAARLNFNIYDSVCDSFVADGASQYRARLEACAGSTPFWRGTVIAVDAGMFFTFRF